MKHFDIIIAKMCSWIGVDPSQASNDIPDWFKRHSWTPEQELGFRNWLSAYLYNDTEARNEIMRFPRRRKKETDETANQFVWNYGWRYEDGRRHEDGREESL